MITIKELLPPNKISGLTSLELSFQYSPEIINIVKSFQPAYYSKKTNTWEVPTFVLPELLDRLTFYDDIDLILADEPKPKQFTPVTDQELSYLPIKPFIHQREAIDFGLAHDK